MLNLFSKKSSPSPSVSSSRQALIDANPYRDRDYYQSPWQNFIGMLGFRTQADAWRENMATQAAEYDAAILQKEYDEEYNSPLKQVERMRAAGLNPDLDGGSNIDPGSAASMPEDPSTPMQATSDGEQIMPVVNGIMSAFSSALGLVSSVQGIAKTSLSNRILALTGDQQVADFAEQMAPKFLRQLGSENDDMNPYEHLDAAYEAAQLFSKTNLPKKYREKFNSAIKNFFDSAPGESSAYKAWYDNISNQKDYYSAKNTFYSPSPEIMDILYKHLGKAQEQLAILGMKKEGAESSRDITEAEYESSVVSGLDPSAESSAKNAEFGARKNQAEVTNILRGTVNGILDDLKNNDSQFGGLFRFLLSCYSLYMFSK